MLPSALNFSSKAIRNAVRLRTTIKANTEDLTQDMQSSSDDRSDVVQLSAFQSDGTSPVMIRWENSLQDAIPSESRLQAYNFMEEKDRAVTWGLLGIGFSIFMSVSVISIVASFATFWRMRSKGLTK